MASKVDVIGLHRVVRVEVSSVLAVAPAERVTQRCETSVRTRTGSLLYASRRYSTVTPLALIGTAHLAISLLTRSPRYCGVACSSVAMAAPSAVSRSRTAGACIASSVASCNFLTIGAGAFFGRKMAFQV